MKKSKQVFSKMKCCMHNAMMIRIAQCLKYILYDDINLLLILCLMGMVLIHVSIGMIFNLHQYLYFWGNLRLFLFLIFAIHYNLNLSLYFSVPNWNELTFFESRILVVLRTNFLDKKFVFFKMVKIVHLPYLICFKLDSHSTFYSDKSRKQKCSPVKFLMICILLR